ncbi:NAD-dependent epimerase/dehydratase family protein [Candidatus Micrarchaeota archaeon]|nr:NAD-dependent epimerase/dehydratase family protein [Candidatus Micrarchaeota archaeon]
MVSLVTGGAGFIASRLAAALEGDVVVVDNLSEGHRENVPPNASFIPHDLRDAAFVENLFKKNEFTHVYHLAAHFANQKSVEDPFMDLEVNGEVTLRLLELSRKYDVERFLYSSSSCVYGAAKPPMREDLRPQPETPYGITKLLGEYYSQYFHDYYGLKATSVRYFNVYGPGEHPGPYRNVIPKFFQAAMKKKPLTITGTGDESRDFTYVDDAVKATLLCSEKTSGKVTNIGNGQPTPIKVLAEKINDLTGNPAPIEFTPRRDWDHIAHRLADVSSLSALGFEPQTSLDEGLEKTHAWLKTVVT